MFIGSIGAVARLSIDCVRTALVPFVSSWTEELPVASDSVDVVVLHHALDFTEQTHRLLREATRVLRPGGHMLIIGFNPASLWGLAKLLRSRNHVPWCGKFISKGRLADWLQLLNLQLKSTVLGLYSPPTKLTKSSPTLAGLNDLEPERSCHSAVFT